MEDKDEPSQRPVWMRIEEYLRGRTQHRVSAVEIAAAIGATVEEVKTELSGCGLG